MQHYTHTVGLALIIFIVNARYCKSSNVIISELHHQQLLQENHRVSATKPCEFIHPMAMHCMNNVI